MCNARPSEPSLDELFGDVAIRLLMQRDGVTESQVRALLEEMRQARAPFSAPARLKYGAAIRSDQTPGRQGDSASDRTNPG
jgi:hypothetical protein